MLATRPQPQYIPLGGCVPALTAHAISVSLPTWDDNVGYEEGDKRVVDKMETGYPRFFIHKSIKKLAALCLAKFGRTDEDCILVPSSKVALEGRDFLASQNPSIPSRIVEFVICPSIVSLQSALPSPNEAQTSQAAAGVDCIELQILLFDKSNFPMAKSFWQHTGDGICSRMAERALAFLGELPAGADGPTSPVDDRFKSKSSSSRNRHYSRRGTGQASTSISSTPVNENPPPPVVDENLTADLTTYLEERYGRNLPLFNAPLAKQALKRRIAGGLLPSDEGFGLTDDLARGGGSGKKAVKEDDVYLYPGGMSAIWHAHKVCRLARTQETGTEGKSVCFGFPYTDTYKILSKWGPGCHFFGKGDLEDLDAFEALLKGQDGSSPRIVALFCEVPSNPLLRTPDLERLRRLADEHKFWIVIDETIGNFINVEVAPYADIIVSSLTKIFSGDSNVMGGSLVANPNGPSYDAFKKILEEDYEDNYYPEDAVFMERNSRDYRGRIKRVNDNAYDVTSYLHSRSLADTTTSSTGKVIKKVYYPRYETTSHYSAVQRLPPNGKGGFGGLFSLTFTSMKASKAFYDALGCAKGPSLGTSFTLASPYTILAHYYELDWAADFGVEEGLVRISVGQEDEETLKTLFETSVKAAEEAERV